MTKKLFVLGMAALLTFALVLTACDNGSGPGYVKGTDLIDTDTDTDTDPGTDPDPSTTEIPTYIVAKVGDHVVEISIDESSYQPRAARARAALPDGIYTYKVEMYGVVVAEGVMIVENGIATYYPDATLTVTPIFTYDPETEELDGKIPLSDDFIAAIEALGGDLGSTLVTVDGKKYLDLEGSNASAARPGGDGYWDGTWAPKENDDINGGEKFVDGWELTFSGNNYTLTTPSGTETGTFVYLDGFMKNDHENLFVFTRPAGKTPKVMAYRWEGGFNYAKANGDAWIKDEHDINDAVKSEDGAFLDLYNSLDDHMGMARDSGKVPGFGSWVFKQP